MGCQAIDSDSRGEGGAGLGKLSILAAAKVNLHLDVGGIRPDGYHEIDTVMQTVSLADTLVLSGRSDDKVTLSLRGRTEGVPSDGENLVLRAARALAETAKSCEDPPASLGADIELEKKIPAGSGLGGGSSDAAAALVGLNQLWRLGIRYEGLLDLAAGLGSDVPFFVKGGTARCVGRGEKVQPLLAGGTMHAVLAFGGPLSTSRVYKVFAGPALTSHHSSGTLNWICDDTVDLGKVTYGPLWNALEEAAWQVRPEVALVKGLLLELGVTAACLSGSGSCVFGLARSQTHAREVLRGMVAAGHEAVVVRSVGPRDM